jgi:nicotinamide mononucleotide transporter
MGSVISWISGNWIEVAAAVVSITYVILAIRQFVWFWFFGILSAGLYAWVYGHSGFYAGMALQAYYAVISIYGWYHWSVKGKDSPARGPLPVIRLTGRLLVRLVLAWLILWLLIGFVLDGMTDSTIPFYDAFATSGGIVATWMLARKILEQWLFWVVIDTFSIGLYLWQGLYVTTILYIVYIIMAIIGYRQWKKTWLEQT